MMPFKTRYMKNTNKYLALILVVLFTTITTAQKRKKIDGVAAVVGENIVLESDISKYIFELEQSGEDVKKYSNCNILEQMMQQKLLAHQAAVDTTLVADAATVKPSVTQKMDYFLQQLGSEEKVLKMYGFDNLEDLEKELTRIEIESTLVGMMRNKVVSSVNVTPDEVRSYFNSLKMENELPEFPTEVKIAQIIMKVKPSEEEIERVTSKLNELRLQIQDGANMKMKAILNSDDPGVTQNGGLYTVMRDSPFIKEFKDMAFSLDEGQVSEPFESDFGYHILKVEKIKGQQLDVRHILIQPKISDKQKEAISMKLDSIRADIKARKITFEEAVKKYSQDKETNKNNGILLNPYTNESTFKLSGEQFMRAFPALHSKIFNLKKGELSEVFYDETREGEKMFKLVLLKDKIEGHKAEFDKDYVKIQKLALSKKRQKELDKWIADNIDKTFIKISEQYKDCEFENNYKKKI